MNTKEELIAILKIHASKYPCMQPVDVVKLLYQNEFGGGHLITDEKKCLERIRTEYASVEHSHGQALPGEPMPGNDRQLPGGVLPLYEDIGNGMVRVNLAAISHEDGLDWLCAAFIQSSAIHQGNMDNFKVKLSILLDDFAQCGLPFEKQELDEYLEQYAKEGYPMVSHSEIYREAYRPAYRVVCKEIMEQKKKI